MKKIFKRNSSSVAAQVEQDVAAQINKIQQQLVSLEQKIDTLISRSQERPFKERGFSKPFRSFDQSHRHDRGRQDSGSRERSFTQAICAECGKECEVPFKPSPDRPVYCRECFARRKSGGSFRERQDDGHREERFSRGRRFDKQQGEESREFGQRKKPFFRRRKDRA